MTPRWFPILLLALVANTAAADETDQARRLAELRADVEALASEIQAVKDDTRGELRSLELQKSDLEARIRAEEVRLKELQRLMERHKEALTGEQVAGEVLKPVLLSALEELRVSVNGSLPYRIEERLADIDKLTGQLSDGSLTPQRGSTRVWQLLEDELRLTRENIMDRQVLTVEGDEVLVDVARIGMVMMYFRTSDARVGVLRGASGGWTTELLSGTDAAQVESLFGALEKQVRVGYFDLPNALPSGS
ncbi:MAG: DUF3450 family protein [Myxococcota bacterium]